MLNSNTGIYPAALAFVLLSAACAQLQESWHELPGYQGKDVVEYESHSIKRHGHSAEVLWRVSFVGANGHAYTEVWRDEFGCASNERRTLDAAIYFDGKFQPYANAPAFPFPWHAWTGEFYGLVPVAALTQLACSGAE